MCCSARWDCGRAVSCSAPTGRGCPRLARANLRLVSWTRRGFDTVSGRAQSVLGRLTRGLEARDILLLHDGRSARTTTGSAVILEVLPPLLAAIAAAGLTPVTLRAAADRAARSP